MHISCAHCGLQRICFPKSLSSTEIAQLDQIVSSHPAVPRSSQLFNAGDAADFLYALKSGVVKLSRFDQAGNEIIHAFYLPGDVLGMEALESPVYPFDAIALDNCTFCRIHRDDLESLAQKIPTLNRQILSMMAQELRLEREHFDQLLNKTAEERVAAFVLSISNRFHTRGLDSTSFRLPILHREVATYLGLTPETFSRVLNRFQTHGWLSWRRKQVDILDAEALQALAEGCAQPECHYRARKRG